MRSAMRVAGRPGNWRGKGLFRVLLLIATAVGIAALGWIFGVARDYGAANPKFASRLLRVRLRTSAANGHPAPRPTYPNSFPGF